MSPSRTKLTTIDQNSHIQLLNQLKMQLSKLATLAVSFGFAIAAPLAANTALDKKFDAVHITDVAKPNANGVVEAKAF
ncbi:hypothetical protein F5X97DRAFT_327934 [Nemania serpens]|nr:hypothetical protein F5X97DRAFT_327934 [Nemania serpens]